jgi:hypothetical protein
MLGRAIATSIFWGVCAVAFGLLPVWTALGVPLINKEVSFSEIEVLKSGAIVIFAITLTVSVLVDYYISRFRFTNRLVALGFNGFFPLAICLVGMLVHIATITAKSDELPTAFVLRLNISITGFAIVFCVLQKIFLVLNDDRGT